MKEGQTVKQLLDQARDIRQKSRTSCVDLENYLLYQQLKLQSKGSSLIPCSLCSRPKTETSDQFKRAFRTMTKTEQAEFYLMNVKNVQKFINSNVRADGNQTQVVETPVTFSEPVIKMKFQVKDGKIFKKFTDVNAEILTKEKIMRIAEVKEDYDLHSYILRKSRGKVKNCLVFESIDAFTSTDTVRICFNSIDFQDSLNIIYKVWQESQYERIKKMLVDDNRFPRRVSGRRLETLKSNPFEDPVPITTALTDKKSQLFNSAKLKDSITNNELSSSINKSAHLRKIENKLVTNQLLQSLNTFNDFKQHSFGLFVEKNGGNRVRKTFQVKGNEITVEKICLAIDDVKHMRRRKPYIKQIKHLNSIPSQRTNLYRQLDEIQSKSFQFLYFRHFLTKNGSTYYFQKSVDLDQFKNKTENTITGTINYCIWRIKAIENKIQILVECDIVYSEKLKNSVLVTSEYLGEFAEYVKREGEGAKKEDGDEEISIETDEFQNQYLSEISNTEEQFFTITGSLNSEQQGNQNGRDIELSDMNMKKKDPNAHEKLLQQLSRQTTQQTQSNDLYLLTRHQLAPKTKGPPILMKQPQGHILFGNEWVISPTGEMVNMNKEKIKMQSSVLKLVLKRMGKNLLAGKSIMNMSLPIEIFGTDTNLERIARGYIFAPIFLERAAKLADPVDRLKQIFCFGLGFSTSYIKMQKPFNPVLGQTYQAIIDGCPVYAEQISHHPPISSTLMIGRGYRVHGNFQAKVEMGLNSASGLNQGFNIIQFGEKGKGGRVRFNTPPGEIQGVVMGDRKLTLTKKSYYLDEENLLFCQLSWGRKKSSPRPDSKLNDFFTGKIVKLHSLPSPFDPKKITSKDIAQEYGELHGRFTGQVYYQDELLFDQAVDAPLLIQDYLPCLMSDGRWRRDVVERRKGNFGDAQDAKEDIQELQRRDKKLRKGEGK